MTGRERVAEAIRVAYGEAIFERDPATSVRLTTGHLTDIPHERQVKWLRMAAAAERAVARERADVLTRAVDTLRGMDCDEDEPCLSTHEVLRMLGANGSN